MHERTSPICICANANALVGFSLSMQKLTHTTMARTYTHRWTCDHTQTHVPANACEHNGAWTQTPVHTHKHHHLQDTQDTHSLTHTHTIPSHMHTRTYLHPTESADRHTHSLGHTDIFVQALVYATCTHAHILAHAHPRLRECSCITRGCVWYVLELHSTIENLFNRDISVYHHNSCQIP